MILTLPRLSLANASFVTPQLLVGGDLEVFDDDLAVAQLVELEAAGLTDIVDLRLEWDDSEWVTQAMPHLRYHHLGVDDAGQRIPDEWFDTGIALVLRHLVDPDARVLVHCHMGINRGPSMGFAVLLSQGWDPIEALDAIRDAREIAYVGYAEDALDWWLRRNGESRAVRSGWLRRLAAWRKENDLDVSEVIRKIRAEENRKMYGAEGAI